MMSMMMPVMMRIMMVLMVSRFLFLVIGRVIWSIESILACLIIDSLHVSCPIHIRKWTLDVTPTVSLFISLLGIIVVICIKAILVTVMSMKSLLSNNTSMKSQQMLTSTEMFFKRVKERITSKSLVINIVCEGFEVRHWNVHIPVHDIEWLLIQRLMMKKPSWTEEAANFEWRLTVKRRWTSFREQNEGNKKEWERRRKDSKINLIEYSVLSNVNLQLNEMMTSYYSWLRQRWEEHETQTDKMTGDFDRNVLILDSESLLIKWFISQAGDWKRVKDVSDRNRLICLWFIKR